ncbi:hypothetical protein L486_03710 [Kwoniella mangroviensis CBS 10435]|uniref:N-acetyltransferase domain-containing protein n=1 Tax=Kwoniella mangroviensis CBS 10435 TaxID=1331196 RepID=A0A1B9IUJ1_9TREE|nr:hypothetical protein L486_03710 [Kwoniella mangroviensis CBS 10435]
MTFPTPNPSSSSNSRPCSIPRTFRIGQPSDAASFSNLLKEVFTKTFSHDLPNEDLQEYLSNTLSNQQIEREIRDDDSIWILAVSVPVSIRSSTQKEEDEMLLGVIQLRLKSIKDCLTLTSSPIELHRIYLSTQTHGKGLSQSILHHAEEISRARGYSSIWLEVYSKHPQGIKFYEKSGFRKCGERIFKVGDEEQVDWVMEKSLIE